MKFSTDRMVSFGGRCINEKQINITNNDQNNERIIESVYLNGEIGSNCHALVEKYVTDMTIFNWRDCVKRYDVPAITYALNLKVGELRVDYTRESGVFNYRQFGQNFVNRVANNQEILLFHRSGNKKILSSEMDVLENISQAVSDLISECLETLDILNQREEEVPRRRKKATARKKTIVIYNFFIICW
ncbi:hypothetical protein Glove_575g46 [Diversispora epigaea]|uniref:Mre11 DNA-binding domain-containing protein n=1 Tax=Diversispora epigaea TaxID=1348612 RepID=A0A397GHW8_9GLOM|nr:hypothetical protein Glove_575g46 [Diversispora epigaea]